MDISEAIRRRRTIRAFKPDPVPREILQSIMEQALRAPSWGNTQPWEFAIVCGEKLEEIRQAFIQRAAEEDNRDLVGGNPELPSPTEYPEPYNTRRRATGKKTLELMGISRDDREGRRWARLQNLTLYGAPTVIYIYTDRDLCFQDNKFIVWPIFDCGLIAENIMLLATKYDLGTTAQVQAVIYPDILRELLGIPHSKLIVLGISIGYPNWDAPINQLDSEREPLDKVAQWHGF